MSSRRRSDAKATENDHNQNSVLSAKVSRALEVRSDTPAMKAALDALAHLPDHQDDLFSVDSRSVRVAIEQDALQQALFLQEKLRGLLDTVSDLRNGVTEIAAIAHEVEDAVSMNVMADSKPPPSDSNSEAKENENAAANTAADIGLEAEQKLALTLSEAFVQRNMAKKRVEAVHAFLEKFDLSEEDSRLLDHYAFEDIETSAVNGMAFLAALERVRVIRLELGQKSRLSDADASRLGASSTLRMMEGLAMKQENAYERLYHWLQKYLRVFGNESAGPNALDEDVLDEALSNPFVLKSLRALKNVPAFHSHLLELIASSRRSEETRRFLIALTSGYQGLPPIEMRAHDAVVYVGDMLAFCFQAFSVEADVAKGVLRTVADDDDDGDEGEVKTPLALDEADYLIEKPMTAAEMVIQSMGGVARPLKSRILQVIANLSRRQNDDYESDDDMEEIEEEGSGARHRLAQLYEICGLLLFYMSAIGKSISKLEDWEVSTEKNPLLDSLVECLEEGTQAYDASLRVYCSMFEQLNLLTGDSESLLAHAMIIKLADLRNTSPGFTTTVECPADCKQALSLDFACKILVEASLPSCKSLDDTVLLKQAIATANESELGEEITLSLRDKIEIRETSLINELVQKETSDVLDLCGLGSLLSALDRFNGVQVDGMVMSAHPGLAPEDVQVAMKEFYTSLYSPPIPSFESTIRDPSLRKSARKKIADSVCDSYKTLYDTMTTSERGGYDDLGFLSHTPEQVSTLFTL
ncbi:unnamed protein product [Cylindrotheca closterium]|uniref:Conserved Oligomeric Golgi complex subunit 6 C-terminal domain-containing protein n=1 Tax=Cylindrotheca closterium TaxID=2856 RepID=A0AAD2FCG0_9STRA|nr:unnamed protein product [Cylindrotheca closterium]